MSDAYYQQRAKRRTRIGCATGGAIAVILLALLGVRSLFYDACTNSFDRSPESVIRSFVEAVRRGDATGAQQCWEHEAYFDLAAGCSEICLTKEYGAQLEITGVSVPDVQVTPAGRANRTATVTITCQGGDAHTAEIVLDGVRQNLPWRHWSIVRSTFGGTVAQPWCRKGAP